MLKYAILGFLSYRPMSGYDIERWMSASTGHFWNAKLSQIYTTLKQMEADGCVQSHIEPQADRPDRRVYTLTPKGEADLSAWAGEIVPIPDFKKDTLLLRVFFAPPEEKGTLLAQLRLQLDLHRKQQQHYEQDSPQAIMEFLSGQPELMSHAQQWEFTRRFGLMYEAMYIQWLQDVIQTLEQSD